MSDQNKAEKLRKHRSWYRTHKKSHLKSNAKWLNKSFRNKHKSKIYRLRSYCKNFILKKATPADLQDIKQRAAIRSRQIRGEKQ